MNASGVMVLAVLAGGLVAACGAVPVRPEPPTVDMVGPLAAVHEFDDSITYELQDGREWARPKAEYEVVYDMPSGATLFVGLSDPRGSYVLLVGGQDGLPADCPYALRYGGTDWGDAIESQGFLWAKASDFVPLDSGPGSGARYPDEAGFCLDDDGHVRSVYVLSPDDSDSGPAASAQG